MLRRHALRDDQWELIEDLLPGKEGDPGRTAQDNRLFVDAVLYVLKTGVPWEDLPPRFGKPEAIRPLVQAGRVGPPLSSFGRRGSGSRAG